MRAFVDAMDATGRPPLWLAVALGAGPGDLPQRAWDASTDALAMEDFVISALAPSDSDRVLLAVEEDAPDPFGGPVEPLGYRDLAWDLPVETRAALRAALPTVPDLPAVLAAWAAREPVQF
jgi:hypothetical protein